MSTRKKTGGWFIFDCLMLLYNATMLRMYGPDEFYVLMVIIWTLLAIGDFPRTKNTEQ